MKLAALTDQSAVLSAIAEFDRLGRDVFLKKYGFKQARRYMLLHEGRQYDSKAIAGAAVGFQYPDAGPLLARDFSGGEATVKARLEHLGFKFLEVYDTESTDMANGALRSYLEDWVTHYPNARATRTKFEASPIAAQVRTEAPKFIRAHLGDIGISVKGSAGQSGWAETSWIVLLDKATTPAVQEGIYLVYLLSPDGARLYLSLNQGCTILKNAIKTGPAKIELRRRAEIIRGRVRSLPTALSSVSIQLDAKQWLGQLYEAGNILAIEYDTAALPANEVLESHLQDAIRLYRRALFEGGWAAEETISNEGSDGGASTLTEAKKYHYHLSVERQSKTARQVKKAQGHRCKGCSKTMAEVYGAVGEGLIHAHHLTPFSQLEEGAVVTLDPEKDFAVLCPNCHAIIHRMADPGDLEGLRQMVLGIPDRVS